MTRGGRARFKRGGGRNFSRHLELNEEGTAVATDPRKSKRDAEDDDDDDEEEDEEEGSEEDESEDEEDESEDEEDEEDEAPPPAGVSVQQQELSRADRKALKKQGKKKQAAEGEDEDEDEDPLLANPNRTVGRMKISDLAASREPTRKEREAKEKIEAKERYMKLHAQGKTDQAQKDLERLTKIRAEREAAQLKRKAEAEAKAAEIEANRKASGRR